MLNRIVHLLVGLTIIMPLLYLVADVVSPFYAYGAGFPLIIMFGFMSYTKGIPLLTKIFPLPKA